MALVYNIQNVVYKNEVDVNDKGEVRTLQVSITSDEVTELKALFSDLQNGKDYTNKLNLIAGKLFKTDLQMNEYNKEQLVTVVMLDFLKQRVEDQKKLVDSTQLSQMLKK